MLTSVGVIATASPKLSFRKIGGELKLMSSFETTFDKTFENRIENIKIAIGRLNNCVIFPDDEFSFNNYVGERSALKGYKLAKVIVNSKYLDDYGGGVCQVSTTLFNAVILANLRISESHQHTLLPSYIEPSFDAMVSFGYKDLRFINDSGGVLKIVAKVSDDKIKIDILGTNLQNNLKIERVSVVEKIIPFERKIIKDDKGELTDLILDENGASHLSFGINGLKSVSYLNFYDNGKFVKQEVLRTDHYKAIDDVIVERK
ncbi:MAG: VanW family protein [Clostridia bacterium]